MTRAGRQRRLVLLISAALLRDSGGWIVLLAATAMRTTSTPITGEPVVNFDVILLAAFRGDGLATGVTAGPDLAAHAYRHHALLRRLVRRGTSLASNWHLDQRGHRGLR